MSFVNIIVAIDQSNGIGIENRLPWHLPEDLAHFKRLTTGNAIIMGRKTFESIGRVLPNRRNIVVSRNLNRKHDGVESVSSLAAAQSLLADQEQAFIIGGAEIYQQSMAFADRLIVTEIEQTFNCDAFFPKIDLQLWQEESREKFISKEKNLSYAIVIYIKK